MLKEKITSKSSDVFVAYSSSSIFGRHLGILNIVITVIVKEILRCSTQTFDTACEGGLGGGSLHERGRNEIFQ